MALTFSYKLVNSAATGTTRDADAFAGATGNVTESAGSAYSDNEVEVYNHGSALDKSRQYWLEVYAKESAPGNNKIIKLDALDLSLNLKGGLFETVDGTTNFQFAQGLDLFRSESYPTTFVEGHGLRFAAGSASSITSGGDGVKIADTNIAPDPNDFSEAFVGRIQLNVADGAVTDSGANLSSYISLTANTEETIVHTQNKNGGTQKVEDLGSYLGTNGSVEVASNSTVSFKSGEFSSNTEAAFDAFGTQLKTATGGDGERTNLVREGQTMTGSFRIDNVGEAALTDLNFSGAVGVQKASLSFDSATLTNGTTSGTTALAISSTTGVLDSAAVLQRGARDLSTGDFTGNADSLEVAFTSTVTGAAGSTAKLDFTNYVANAAGESAHSVFATGAQVIQNLVTYKADINYDGKVGMMDLATLNAAHANGGDVAGAAKVDSDINHDKIIDITDLTALGDQWGQSLFFDGSAYVDATDTSFDMESQNASTQSAQAWTNSAFEAAGDAAAEISVADHASDLAMFTEADTTIS